MTLGNAMKQRRAEMRKTAAECAALAGMTSSEWSRWESGQSRRKDGLPSEPRAETFSAIASALELRPQELRQRAGYETVPALDVSAEWALLWIETPPDVRPRLLKATRGVKEALSI